MNRNLFLIICKADGWLRKKTKLACQKQNMNLLFLAKDELEFIKLVCLALVYTNNIAGRFLYRSIVETDSLRNKRRYFAHVTFV